MNPQIQRVEPEEARKLLDSGEGYTYLDVRTQEEFDAGHVPGAVCIPVLVRSAETGGMQPNPEFLSRVEERFDKEAKIITACLRGGRSLRAADMLIRQGFTGVVDMRGGYDGEMDPGGNITFPGWARRGLPTTND